MERRKNEKRSSGRVQVEQQGGRGLVEEEEDYGDYVTRCICGFKHDDGYMICCDECSVWQHVDCMQVDPKNLPENYLCELCEPRPVDKRRAQKIQTKKREDISDAEESRKRKASGQSPLSRLSLPSAPETKKPSSLLTSAPPPGGVAKKRKKRGKLLVPDPTKGEGLRKSKREKPEFGSSSGGGSGSAGGSVASASKKRHRTGNGGKGVSSHVTTSSGSIQSLLTAASLLDEDTENVGGAKTTPSRRKSDLWSSDKSPWTDKYEAADQNLYTEPVRAFLVSRMDQLKSEEVVYSREEYDTMVTRPHPQCMLAEVGPKRQGVVVVRETVPQDELVIECKGKIAMKQDVLADMNAASSRSLWKHKPCPFVYLYDKIANLDLCIDSRSYGNLTRFIRRSCCPNAEVRHFFVSSELHFGVYALTHIAPDEEVTLPFDFRYDKCDYTVECGCGQSRSVCLVARGKYPSITTPSSKSTGGVATDEGYLSPRPQGSSLQRSHSHVFVPQDEDSNSSWTSTASSGRKRSRISSGHTPYKTQSLGPSRDGSSDSEEDTDKARKSLSREERKTEQVWRVFEKMEASAQRRRQQLLSEGSHDSDPLSSPSSLQPHPLTTRVLKDRRSSASSRGKVQLLPGGKMRLSSVSSTDPLSPYDPGEPFSPPLTPSLAPPTVPGIGGGAELRSPLPLLSPTSPVPHFQAAPQLHPKYLFADFALPWKKAILRQWESEQLNGHAPQSRSYWVSNDPYMDCYHHVTRDMRRPRTRGSLKHRWLKHYNEVSKQEGVASHDSHMTSLAGDASGSDKENSDSDRLRLSYKQRFLLRWQGSEVTGPASSPVSLPPSSPNAPTPTLAMPSSGHAPSGETPPTTHLEERTKSAQGGMAGRRGSPLFEEFSDSEDFVEENSAVTTTTPPSQEPALPVSTLTQPISPVGSEDHTPKSPPTLDSVPVLMVRGASPFEGGSVQGAGHVGSFDQEGEEPGNLSGVSDISMESITHGPATPTTGPQTPPTPETTPSHNPTGVSDISSDTVGSSQSADVSISEGGLKSADTSASSVSVATPPGHAPCGDVREGEDQERDGVTVCAGATGEGVGGEEGGKGPRPPPLESLGPILAPPSPLSSQNTPSKTPGKRKITYNEYRSRARKPAEKKMADKPAASVPVPPSSSSPPPPTTPGTPSFLAHSFFTSPSLSAYASALSAPSTGPPAPSLLSHAPPLLPPHAHSLLPHAPALLSAPTLQGTSPTPTTENAPYFEPVSPEDGDHTPKLVTHEDASVPAVSAVGSGVPLPMGGGVGGVASPLTYTLPSSSLQYGAYMSMQQPQSAPPPSGLVGGANRWVPVEQGHDPRNRPPGVVVSSSGASSASSVPPSLMQTKPHPQPSLLGPLPPPMVATQGAGQGVYSSQQGGYYTGAPPQQQQQPPQAQGVGHPPHQGIPLFQPRPPPSGPGGGGANYY